MIKSLQSFCKATALLFLSYGLFINHTFAQAPINVPITVNGGTTGNIPIGVSNYHVSEAIYTTAEIGANFTTAATAINAISFNCTTAATANTTVSNYKVYLKEVSSATTTLAVGIYSTTGYTLVYNGSFSIATTGWKMLPLTTSFTRTSSTNNIEILIERTDNLVHTGAVFAPSNGNSASSTAISARRYNGTTAPVSGTTNLSTANTFRAALAFHHIYNANDAAVQQIYTLGKLPTPYANPHVIRANIVNSGSTTKTSIPVTLTVSGANTHTDVQTIASLAPYSNTTVSFLSFSPTVTGTNTVTVTIPADGYAPNNTASVSQTVSGNAYTYAYGTTLSGNVGFNGNTGDFLAKFSTSSATSLNQVDVTFTSGGNPYKIGVWDATGAGGTPGTLIWESAAQTTAAGVATIPVSPAVSIASGDFFVGVRQTGTVNVGFGYQIEDPIRSGTFYFMTPAGGTVWTDFAPNNPFKFMIEPKLAITNDVAIANIVAPASASNVELCGSITPSANLFNPGLNAQTNIDVVYSIKQGGSTVYTNTERVTSIASGATQLVTFPATNLPIAAYTAECTAVLTGDLDISNNTKTIAFNVQQNNFGTTPTYKYSNSYACAATTPIPAATYSWITQQSNEVTWSGGAGDDNFQLLTLPFPFTFYGTVYNSIYVSSNGWASFSDPTALTGAAQRTPVTIPTAGGLENYIAGAMKDLDMTIASYPNSHLYYGGNATQFVMTWWHANNFSLTPATNTEFVTFQIIIKSDGNIKLQYNDAESTLPAPPTSITNASTIGTENATGTEGVKYRFGTTGGPMFGSPMAVDIQLVTPLPLSLLSFNAKNINAKNNLIWRTASEENMSHFVIQRSADGVKFSDIGLVKANNKRNLTNNYTFTDEKPLSGTNYYRLKMMERDGKADFSMMRMLNSTSILADFKIYPNPAHDLLSLSFQLSENSDCNIEIFDAYGKLILTQNGTFRKGVNGTQLDLTSLASGVYIIKVVSENTVLKLDKFTKM